MSKKVGLALSGGGARALAHIGVIEALEKIGVKISFICGTSMGALVGGWYAANKEVKSLKKLFLFIRKNFPGFGKILDNSDSKNRQFRDKTITRLLVKNIGSIKIENCSIPFAAIATNLKNKKQVVLKKGNLAKAIKASMSLPLIFSPVKIGKYWLVDGGFSNPIPVDVVKKMGAEFIVAVDVTSDEKIIKILEPKINWKKLLDYTFSHRLLDSLIAIYQHQLIKACLKNADIVLKPKVSGFKLFEFDKIEQIVTAGVREVSLRQAEFPSEIKYPKNFFKRILDFFLKKIPHRF